MLMLSIRKLFCCGRAPPTVSWLLIRTPIGDARLQTKRGCKCCGTRQERRLEARSFEESRSTSDVEDNETVSAQQAASDFGTSFAITERGG
jgi:hypothetical protein